MHCFASSTPVTDTKYEMKILSLSLELVCEVLLYLDAKTLVTLQQVCKAFHSLINDDNSAIVWKRFISELESRPGYSRLEAPWTEYSVQGLSKWALTRFRMDEFWNSNITQSQSSATQPTPESSEEPLLQPRQPTRTFDFNTNSRCRRDVLLPGGRWLLEFNGEKTVQVFSSDLNATESISNVLITATLEDLDNDSCRLFSWFWAHWADRSRQSLSIRLALWPTYTSTWTDEVAVNSPAIHYIYEIGVTKSQQLLQAKQIASFSLPSPGVGYNCTNLDGTYFSKIHNYRSVGSLMTVIKYREDSENGQQPLTYLTPITVRITTPEPRVLHICNDQIIIFTPREILIYSLSQLQVLQQQSQNDQQNKKKQERFPLLHPLHHFAIRDLPIYGPSSLPNHLYIWNLSNPTIIPADSSIRFTFHLNRRIWGIHIPSSSSSSINPQEVKLISLAHQPPNTSFHPRGMGYYRSLFLSGEDIIAVTHNWDAIRQQEQEHGHNLPLNSYSRVIWKHPSRPRNQAAFSWVGHSEEIGRILWHRFEDFGRKQFTVLDLV